MRRTEGEGGETDLLRVLPVVRRGGGRGGGTRRGAGSGRGSARRRGAPGSGSGGRGGGGGGRRRRLRRRRGLPSAPWRRGRGGEEEGDWGGGRREGDCGEGGNGWMWETRRGEAVTSSSSSSPSSAACLPAACCCCRQCRAVQDRAGGQGRVAPTPNPKRWAGWWSLPPAWSVPGYCFSFFSPLWLCL
jgi:hypothetical protein